MAQVIQRGGLAQASQNILQLIMLNRRLTVDRERIAANIDRDNRSFGFAALDVLLPLAEPNSTFGDPNNTALRQALEKVRGESMTDEQANSFTLNRMSSMEEAQELLGDEAVKLLKDAGAEDGKPIFGGELANIMISSMIGRGGQTQTEFDKDHVMALLGGETAGILLESLEDPDLSALDKSNMMRRQIGLAPKLSTPYGTLTEAEANFQLSSARLTETRLGREQTLDMFNVNQANIDTRLISQLAAQRGLDVAPSVVREMAALRSHAARDIPVGDPGPSIFAHQNFVSGPESLALQASSGQKDGSTYVAQMFLGQARVASGLLGQQIAKVRAVSPEAAAQIEKELLLLETMNLVGSIPPEDTERITGLLLNSMNETLEQYNVQGAFPLLVSASWWKEIYTLGVVDRGTITGFEDQPGGGDVSGVAPVVEKGGVSRGLRNRRMAEEIARVKAGDVTLGQVTSILKQEINLTNGEIALMKEAIGRGRRN